jgi:hypothetical protein
MDFKNKLVAIINKELDVGVAMNAIAHMTLGLGSQIEKEDLRLDNYKDSDGNIYPNISQMPFIVLRAKSSEIQKTLDKAREANILYCTFLDTMTGGTYQEQILRTSKKSSQELVYYGLVLFGEWEKVSAITKKFSIYVAKAF